MKSLLIAVSILAVSCGEISDRRVIKDSQPVGSADTTFRKGSGAPSGGHFNLNIIGVPKSKSAEMTGNNGHRIFVSMTGKTKVLLSEGDFQVLDGNGTDGSASFQLPHPDPAGTGEFQYSVFARALGKPGGSSRLTVCATDPELGDEICSVSSLISQRTKGKSSFTNVSKDLLSITADIDGDGTLETVPLFDESLEGFLWDYDNNGLKLLQLRFYPGVKTTF